MKRSITAILAGGAVFGATVAFAATLSVTGQTIGAGDSDVVSCDTTGVVATYAVAWDATDKRFEVGTITVNGIDSGCAGKAIKVQVLDEADAPLAGATFDTTVQAGGGDQNFSPTNVPAKSVGHIGVTIFDAVTTP